MRMYSLADAMSIKADWGHSSNIVGVELCQMAGARHLCLFHHEPADDDEAIERVLADTRRLEEITRTGEPLRRHRGLRRDGNRACDAARGAQAGRAPARPHPRSWAAAVLVAAGGADRGWQPPGLRACRRRGSTPTRRSSPRQVESMPATVVEIDEKSLAALGQWPWPRTLLAQLVDAISEQQPAAIGVDILMPEADALSPGTRARSRAAVKSPAWPRASQPAVQRRRACRALAAARRRARRWRAQPSRPGGHCAAPPFSVAIRPRLDVGRRRSRRRLSRDIAGVLTSIDELDRAAAGRGLVSVEPAGGVIRRIPLVASIDGTLVPALAVEMLRVAVARAVAAPPGFGRLGAKASRSATSSCRPRTTAPFASTIRRATHVASSRRSTCSRAGSIPLACSRSWC